MKVNQNKIRVVVPEKAQSIYVDGRNVRPASEYKDYNTAINDTLQSELPDVNECVEISKDKIFKLLRGDNYFNALRISLCVGNNAVRQQIFLDDEQMKLITQAIATSTNILKWREG